MKKRKYTKKTKPAALPKKKKRKYVRKPSHIISFNPPIDKLKEEIFKQFKTTKFILLYETVQDGKAVLGRFTDGKLCRSNFDYIGMMHSAVSIINSRTRIIP